MKRSSAFAILVLLLLGVVMPVGAVTCPTYGSAGSGGSYSTREAAYAACASNPAPIIRMGFGGFVYGQFAGCVRVGTENGYRRQYVEYLGQDAGGQCVTSATQRTQNSGLYSWSSECPAGSTWDEASKKCFNPQQCLAKNDSLGNTIQSTTTSTNGCDQGCAMSMGTNYTPTVWEVNGTQVTMFTGPMRYTGLPCSGTPTKPPNNEEPECTAIEGQSVCKRPKDNKLCAQASTGKYACWAPGETGEKTTDNVKQKRDAGPNPIPPNLSLPNGDTLQQQGNTIKTQESSPGKPTVTTNITNYMTINGTNAGPSNQGENADGTGSEEEGDGEGEEGTATGGGDCETPPIVTGDAVAGMIANQAWSTRCAVEAGNAAKVTGDVGNCAQPFTVEGTNANAVELRAMRAQLCKGDENGNGRPDWTETNGSEAGDGDEGNDGEPGFLSLNWTPDVLDTSGFLGNGSCPQFGSIDLFFTQINLDDNPYFCQLVTLMRAVLLMIGAFIALRLLMGDA